MTFARVNVGGWALYETLTSAQMNQLDINVSNALDGDAGGSYTPSASLIIFGKIVAEAVKTRTVMIPMSDGVRNTQLTDLEWQYTPLNNDWRTPNHDGVSRTMAFPLNGRIVQGAILNTVTVRINSGAGLGSTSGVKLELCRRTAAGTETVIDTQYDSGAGNQTVVLTMGSAFRSDLYDYFVRVRCSTNTDATHDHVTSMVAEFDDGDYTQVP